MKNGFNFYTTFWVSIKNAWTVATTSYLRGSNPFPTKQSNAHAFVSVQL
ncbi:hypothetical protein [Emticicia aquatilis]|nr:hypothetical protein [Emticicia aquatilis]